MYETLRRILVEDLHLNATATGPDASCENAGLDALAMAELSMVLQERLNLDISDDELRTAKRVSDIVRMMEERRAPDVAADAAA